MSRTIERRLAWIEAQQDEARQEREAMETRHAHLSLAELQRLVLSRMTDHLAARSYPAPAGTISPAAIKQARQAFGRHPACLAVLETVIIHQEPIHATH